MTVNQLGYLNYLETVRANTAREEHNENVLAEERRSNLVREAETKRSNVANEWLKHLQLEEQHRSNVVNETETHRANVARETETHRANVAYETELRRSNIARETETHRANVAHEILGHMELAEKARHNQQTEILDYTRIAKDYEIRSAQLDEQKRANLAGEALRTAELNEDIRYHNANIVNQSINTANNVLGNLIAHEKNAMDSLFKGFGMGMFR